MSTYKAPLADMRFVMFDLLQLDAQYARIDGGANATRDVVDAILDEAAKFAETVLAPLNAPGDEQGCTLDKATGAVTTPPGFKDAYAKYIDGGWSGLTAPEAYGGQHLPESIGAPLKEMLDSANLSWGNFPLLSHGATEALRLHGEEWQRVAFLKPIVEGRWTGTMCLTEPHCGSDLGLLKTRAEPEPDGTHRISGTKIFITAGEHDLTQNIVHLVLARLPDAPAGVKGISLFIVPKHKVDKSGNVGARNAVSCGAIEHKMGIHASVTCVMNFDGAQGYLIGAPNKGLNAMFTMMNTARLAVGIQGLGLIERAYQGSLAHARERLQGRALSGAKFPDRPADPLIVHPDIRRMLLTQKSFAEGGRALAYYAASLVDLVERSADAAERKRADELLSFIIPIVKALLTEAANECTYHAVQIFGGHGYIHETGMEQFARDARITSIYEGTTQIQALDLLGRKIMQTQGVGLKHFLEEIGAFCQANIGNAAVQEFVAPLATIAKQWADLTQEIGKRAAVNPDEIGVCAVDYLFYSGYIALAYFWARSVAAAEGSAQAREFKQAKLGTARFYFARILPRTLAHAAAMRANPDSLMAIPAEQFG
ncbi:MAG: acyl-CoA dehydrogenase C-terminal domain-containing protein [Xanthomonadaceae bacterium]|nr:acyl-CoA dehydrogenase C-terminal domain-containing protein [Xanthomonadaceae bacterium]